MTPPFVPQSYEIRIPADQGIAGHVATTGKILNIKDAYSHPLFYRGVDDSTGFRTRNILCFPIKNEGQGGHRLGGARGGMGGPPTVGTGLSASAQAWRRPSGYGHCPGPPLSGHRSVPSVWARSCPPQHGLSTVPQYMGTILSPSTWA